MLRAPKHPLKNAEFRAAIIERCLSDMAFREEVYIQCSRDFVFWCDTFAYTLSFKEHANCPDVPFILYPYQEEAARNLIAAIGKEDRLVEKARDMGATWLILMVFLWFFLFRRKMSFLIGSRKQEMVDKTGDPKTLYSKLDYALENLPAWMRPPTSRNLCHLKNEQNESVIDGESTNANFGAGDRRAAVMLDEFALVDCGYQILAAVGDVTNCCIYNSTPCGASGAYFDTRQKFAHNYPHRLITFNWWKHPRKSRGLYTTDTGKDGGKLKILDAKYKFPADYKFVLDGKMRSPAYDERESRSPSRAIMASQWDICYAASGGQAFDADKIEVVRKKYAQKPHAIGDLFLNNEGEVQWREFAGGKLRLWFKPLIDGTVPPAWSNMGIGCDIAAGTGGEFSSNSVASVVNRSTGEKVAEIATNRMYPPDFADYVLLMLKWFNNALLVWETNGGHGQTFTDCIRTAGYRHVYKMRSEESFDKTLGGKPGWRSSPTNKAALLSSYFEAMVAGTFINHSDPAITECGEYILDGSKYEHQRSLVTEDPTAKGDAHGDRVIADALANRLIADLVKDRTSEESEPPDNSYRGRRLAYERDKVRITRSWGKVG